MFCRVSPFPGDPDTPCSPAGTLGPPGTPERGSWGFKNSAGYGGPSTAETPGHGAAERQQPVPALRASPEESSETLREAEGQR